MEGQDLSYLVEHSMGEPKVSGMASTRFPSALPPHAPVALKCRTSETAPQAVNLLTGSGPSLILLD